MASLFLDNATLNGRRPLMQIRAGRMTKEGTRVTADPRPGVLSIVNDRSGAIELLWSSGVAGERPDVITLFRGEATVSRVTKVTDGRVIVVDLGSNQAFYWLQETTTERDDDVLKVMKSIVEKKAAAGAAATTAGTGVAARAADGVPAAAAAPPPSAAAPVTAGVTTNDITDIRLEDALLSDALLNALRANPDYYANRLRPFLPERAPEAPPPSSSASASPSPAATTTAPPSIVESLRNPQATAMASILSDALQQPEGFIEVVSSFQLPVNRSEAQEASVLRFIRSVQVATFLQQQANGDAPAGVGDVVDDDGVDED